MMRVGWLSLSLLTATVTIAAGCDRAAPPPPPVPACPEPPAPPACPPAVECPPPPPPGLGSVDRGFLDLSLATKKIDAIELALGLDGSITKLAIEHGDAEAIPAAVRALAEATFPGAKIEGFERELDASGELFEVELKVKGKECEVSARADGTLVYTECDAPVKELSAPILDVVKKLLPGGKISGVKTITRGEAVETEVEVDFQGEERELVFNAAGELVRQVRKIEAELEIAVP
jgi:hypothetical protein